MIVNPDMEDVYTKTQKSAENNPKNLSTENQKNTKYRNIS